MKIAERYIYPIQSSEVVSIKAADLTLRGLADERRFYREELGGRSEEL